MLIYSGQIGQKVVKMGEFEIIMCDISGYFTMENVNTSIEADLFRPYLTKTGQNRIIRNVYLWYSCYFTMENVNKWIDSDLFRSYLTKTDQNRIIRNVYVWHFLLFYNAKR